jgi:lysophospholipase L1-like esterase
VSRRRRFPAALGLALLLAAALPAAAQIRYLAFGDSITAGVGDDPDRPEPGYPPRLQEMLVDAGVDAVVENDGLGGERTPEGLTRIDEVLAGGGDVLLLMEGSNDISRMISIETTRFNLNQMSLKAERLGLEAVQATVIPRIPTAAQDSDNVFNQRLCELIRNTAGSRNRHLVDNFEVFGRLPDLFTDYYISDPEDHVGHPNAAGYDVMAQTFFDVLTGVDSVPPVTGVMDPPVGQRNVPAGTRIDVDVWDFGEGIDLAHTSLLVDGEVVDAMPGGDEQMATFRYQPPAALVGVVTLGLRSQDRAVPANTVDREVSHFIIAGTVFLDGDLDESGRVDGSDLVRFALLFGSHTGDGRYQAAADFNQDGLIDGMDLAVLAGNFGHSSF